MDKLKSKFKNKVMKIVKNVEKDMGDKIHYKKRNKNKNKK